MHVTVTGRTHEQVEAVAAEIGGRALVGDVSKREDVERWAQRDRRPRPARLQRRHQRARASRSRDPDEWWRTFEVNVLGVYLCCHAFAPRMVERGGGRIVNVASGAAYCRRASGGRPRTARARRPCIASRSCSRAELAPQNVFVFSIRPGS